MLRFSNLNEQNGFLLDQDLTVSQISNYPN